jgi:HAD superfamily hydrolase (TIGR01509 family)
MNKTASELRAVVFDLDGLIANTEDLYEEVGEILLSRRGKIYDRALREQVMGRPAMDALQLMIDCHALAEPLDALMCECKEVLEVLMATTLAAMPGLEMLLSHLQMVRMPIAVATSSTAEYAHYVLDRLGVQNLFQFVLTADHVRYGKPDPEIYLLAARTIGVAPQQMMALEDSANGCRAAVSAGAYTVAVPNRHTRGHLFPGAQFIADTLADPRILAALSQSG